MNIPVRMIMYDMMYTMADTLIKADNPCRIHMSKRHKTVRCRRMTSPCCDECEHLSSTGCTVKCLICKLFMCGLDDNELLHAKLYGIQNIGRRFDLLITRTSRGYIRNQLKRDEEHRKAGRVITIRLGGF